MIILSSLVTLTFDLVSCFSKLRYIVILTLKYNIDGKNKTSVNSGENDL